MIRFYKFTVYAEETLHRKNFAAGVCGEIQTCSGFPPFSI